MKTVIAIIVVIIIAVGGYALVKNNNNKTSTPPSTTSTTNSVKSSSSTSPTTSSTSNPVGISNYAFSPASIIVKKGSTVTWINKDAVAHTVTETDGKDGPKSSDLNQNQTYSFTYKTAGTFKYHCSIHTYMTGTVTVTD